MFISQSSYCHRFNEVKNLEQSIDFHDITDNMGHFLFSSDKGISFARQLNVLEHFSIHRFCKRKICICM